MTDLDRIEDNGKKIGAYCMSSAMQATAWWLSENWEAFESLRGKEGASGIMKEILTLGLRELQVIRAQIEDEERERSEKDCLWGSA